MIKIGTLIEFTISGDHIRGVIINSISVHMEYKVRFFYYGSLIHHEWWIHECDIIGECK